MTTLASLQSLPDNFIAQNTRFKSVLVTGEENAKYLHAQLTVNTENFVDGKARFTAHCDFKGKAWAIHLITKTDNDFVLTSSPEAMDASLAQLEKYGVFNKVEFVANDTVTNVLLAHGPLLASFVEQHFGALEQAMDYHYNDLGTAIKWQGADQYQLLLSDAGQQTLAAYCDSHSIAAFDQAVFNAINVRDGIPYLGAEAVNQWVPQMVNIQHLDGIDFNKGCYMGQEVVARTRYLGKNKRAMFALKLDEAVTVDDATTLEKSVGENWRKAGSILFSATLGEETWLQAVLPMDSTNEEEFRLSTGNHTQLELVSLPYQTLISQEAESLASKNKRN